MSFRQLLRKPPSLLHPRPIPRTPLFRSPRRHTSTSSPETKTRARIDRLLTRLPRFLHPYVSGLRNAPISHIVSFLILHEITAIVPLVGLAGLFHYTQWLPTSFVEGKWVTKGMEMYGRYFGRKGWFGFSREGREEGELNGEGSGGGEREVGMGQEGIGQEEMIEGAERKWRVGERGGRILVEVATAYAITKVMLPARILVSVWGTPWFARVVLGRVGRVFGRKGP
ncbi:hypothetical protein N431DRAFT_355138 [Stipitochalara longipes BDJ]|nr:hypothetical protein N431DRAFT_355138 [Stipitochalara longipes BDJ]